VRGTSACDVSTVSSSCCGPKTAAVTRDGSPAAITLAAATSVCCGPVTAAVAREDSPVTVALATVRGTLAERRPIVAGALDLSALAGARAGTIGVTLSTRKQE
jgi:hypothetical protein